MLKHKPKWRTNEIETDISQKKHAHLKYNLTNNEDDRLHYGRLRQHTKKLIRENKRNLEVYIASTAKANPKEFYSYVRKKKVLTSTIGPLSLQNGQLKSDEKKMADLLNEYFASVFTKKDMSDFS